ncbi:MAG TPA: DNA primase [Candidatus Avisuccinivibrio pullicola]|nr:DNA primase [Candidatus Avisuccinivibrio pullicola]
MPLISKDFIVNRLLPAVKIDSLIGSYVTLKPKGNNLSCCCPFHQEKTPSFYVTPSRGTYHCFGCGAHGNVIDFLMKFKNLSFTEAIEELAQFAGIPVEYEDGGNSFDRDKYARYYDLMDRCAAFFVRELTKSKAAQDYWYKKRELSKDTVLKNRLGFAPADWDNLRQVARSDEEYRILADLGMVNVKENGKSFAMFRNRVMIPIVNLKGKVISFGGRTMGDDEPKYLNTRETPIFRKRKELFGLYETLAEHRNRPASIVIVEGYMDVIALRQAGVTNAVASLGTATTPDHFKLMYRYTKKVICCYDGDKAGRKAAWHALETVSPILTPDCEMRFAFLPPEHDPDSLVRAEGAGGFQRFLDAAISFPEFLIRHCAEGFDLADPGLRSQFIAAVLPHIKAVAALPLQSVCVMELSKVLSLDEKRVFEMLDALPAPQEAPSYVDRDPDFVQHPKATEGSQAGILNTPMRRLVAFALQQPTVVALMYDRVHLAELPELLSTLGVRGVSELKFLYDRIAAQRDITPAQLIEVVRDTPREKAFNVLSHASFIPNKANGEELSMDARSEFLCKLIAESIYAALEYQTRLVTIKGKDISREDMLNVQKLGRLLARRFTVSGA